MLLHFLRQKIKVRIKEINVDGELVFLSKKGGWHVVHPAKIDGKINWKNLIAGGNWWNLLKIAVIVGIILICINEYSNAVKIANDCLQSSILFGL